MQSQNETTGPTAQQAQPDNQFNEISLDEYLAGVEKLAAKSAHLWPVKRGYFDKKGVWHSTGTPFFKGWNERGETAETIAKTLRMNDPEGHCCTLPHSVGIVVVDIDKGGSETAAKVCAILGNPIAAYASRAGGERLHLLYASGGRKWSGAKNSELDLPDGTHFGEYLNHAKGCRIPKTADAFNAWNTAIDLASQTPPVDLTKLITKRKGKGEYDKTKRPPGRPKVDQARFVDFIIAQGWPEHHLFDPATGWHYREASQGLWECEGFDKPPRLIEALRQTGKDHGITSYHAAGGCAKFAEASPAFRREQGFDTENHLVGVPFGYVFDLRNLANWQPTAELVSKKLGADPVFSEPDLWLQFLKEVLPSQADIDYAQVLFGMCLTGYARHHVAHLLYGEGRNGKSVFLHVLQAVAGDYHASLPADALSPYKDRHPEWLARLVGARVATADEMHGGAWNSPAFKELSTGARMIARFMRQNSFEFTPKASLVFGGNKFPAIGKGTDEYAMQERIRILHFNQTIAKQDRNPDLTAKLTSQAELQKIVWWAMRGAQSYLTQGLPDDTAAMVKLRRKWRPDEIDPILAWVRANLEECPDGKLSYQSIMAKAKAGGVTIKEAKTLTPSLRHDFPLVEAIGGIYEGNKSVRGVQGIRFKQPTQDDIPPLMQED